MEVCYILYFQDCVVWSVSVMFFLRWYMHTTGSWIWKRSMLTLRYCKYWWMLPAAQTLKGT